MLAKCLFLRPIRIRGGAPAPAEDPRKPERARRTGYAHLSLVEGFVESVPVEVYGGLETISRQRLTGRDAEDWPILALALTLGCPVWTEDADFFGCGVATWTTDRVELYLKTLARPKVN
jgi:predicted nucleic acid-binding protein